MPERYGRRVMPSIQRKPPVLPGHSGASQPALGHADPLAISSSVLSGNTLHAQEGSLLDNPITALSGTSGGRSKRLVTSLAKMPEVGPCKTAFRQRFERLRVV